MSNETSRNEASANDVRMRAEQPAASPPTMALKAIVVLAVVLVLLAGCTLSVDSGTEVSEEKPSSTEVASGSEPGATPTSAGGACAPARAADGAEFPDDFGPLRPGRGGAGDDEQSSDPCVVSTTSTESPGRHLTFGAGASPYGSPTGDALANGARTGEIHEGFAAEATLDGETVHLLGYGLSRAEFDRVASSL